jgi:hypothetical protein
MMAVPGRSGTVLLVPAVTAFAYAFAIVGASGQAMDAPPMSVVEAAKAVAHTIDTNTSKSMNGPIVFLSATARNNVVEIQYAAKDPTSFANNKRNLDNTRLAMARNHCASSRVSFLKIGGAFRIIMLAPDNTDRIEINIDRATCANLPVPKLADAESLARMAQAVAARELAENSGSKAKGLFQYEGARSHEGVVEIHAVVTDPSVGENLKVEPYKVIAFFTGYFCSRYRDEIGQGLSIHEKFALADGSPVADFTVGKSSCGF